MWKPIAFGSLLFVTSVTTATPHEVRDPAALQQPEIQDLLTTALESSEGLDVIVSHVALPPNVTLPLHWHPGEEFAYILQGSATLILDGEGEQDFVAGDVAVVPLKKVHGARSGNDGATILVFRIHEEGQPGRVLVNE